MEKELLEKIDLIIQKIDLLLNSNDWVIQIICALIGAIGLIISVLIGAKSFSTKIKESKVELINKNDSDFDKLLIEVKNQIEDIDFYQLNYKLLENFYNEHVKKLSVLGTNASTIRNSGCYIIDRYSYNMFTYRLRNLSSKRYNKIDMIDSNFFHYLDDIIMYLNYASKKFISLSQKNKTLDPLQKKLGGPKKNYIYQKINCIDNTTNYDGRYFLYYDLFKLINQNAEDSSIKAFSYIFQNQILYITSKFLYENKQYIPLTFSDDDNHLPKFFLSGINYEFDLISEKHLLKARYINFYEHIICTKNYIQKITNGLLKKFDTIDKKFLDTKPIFQIEDNDSILIIKFDLNKCQNFYKKNKMKVLRKYKKIHKN